ncbi:MAG: hypothetical protein ACYTEQ_29130, partial [Planctomycetota bacterium]
MTKSNEKKVTPQEAKLIELLADPFDTRSKEDKSKAAGFAPKTVYGKAKQPHFVKALEARCEERVNELKRSYRAQVIRALAERAEECKPILNRDGEQIDVSLADANRAAELFLKVTGDIGSGGHTTHVNVEQHNTGRDEETLEDAIRRISGERWD